MAARLMRPERRYTGCSMRRWDSIFISSAMRQPTTRTVNISMPEREEERHRRRGPCGREYYQEMKDGNMVFNISKICDIGTEMTNNFSYERVDRLKSLRATTRNV